MPQYAQNTLVSSERSRGEIERILARYGADQFLYGWDQMVAVVGFRMQGRMIRLRVPLPDRTSPEFTMTPSGRKKRSAALADVAWEQACRQRWRALALVVKAKLEAVECGISSFEEEFLAWTMLPDGSTVADTLLPQLETTYRTGEMPALLPWGQD